MQMKRKKRNKAICIIICIATVFNLFGCKGVNVKIRDKDYTEYDLKVEEKKIDTENPVNVKYHTDGDAITNKTSKSKVKENLLKDDDKISLTDEKGFAKIYTYSELAEAMTERLQYDFQDYRMKEILNYNYSQFTELNLNGVYINEEVDTVRKSDQYYRDDKRLVGKQSYLRKIEAIKFRDKSTNDVEKGTFTTREKNKKVNLEWEHIEFDPDTKDIQNFIDIKSLNFVKITNFYRVDDWNNYKAKGQATLRDFLNWCTIKNTGINTLRDDEVEITREVVEKGVTVEKLQRVKPLNAKIDFVIEVITNEEGEVTINLTTDLTSALKIYYKIYENYDIINADYSLNIIRYLTEAELEGIDETDEDSESEEGELIDEREIIEDTK